MKTNRMVLLAVLMVSLISAFALYGCGQSDGYPGGPDEAEIVGSTS